MRTGAERVAVKMGRVLRRGKQGSGGSAATAGMRVCKQSGSEESWECGARGLKPQRGERRTKEEKQKIRSRNTAGEGNVKSLSMCHSDSGNYKVSIRVSPRALWKPKGDRL